MIMQQRPYWIAKTIARARLAQDLTLFVDPVNGLDTNNGLTAASAFQTIQHAVQYIGTGLDLNGFNCTVQLAHGTYAEAVTLTPYVGRSSQGHTGPVVIQGDAGSPTACIIQPPLNTAAFAAVECAFLEWIFQNLKIDCATNSGFAFLADVSGWIVLNGGITITGTSNSNSHMVAENGGLLEILGNYTLTGGANAHWFAQARGEILTGSPTITLTGTPAFSAAFVFSERNALVLAPGVTFSGAATGTRFTAITGGGIDTNGGGANYFPGNAAGSATSPGWYN